MLRQHRYDNSGIFRALALVDRGGVSQNERVELAEAVGDRTFIEKPAVSSPVAGSTSSTEPMSPL